MADSSNKLKKRHAFKAAGNLIKLLPTGTVFMFQCLSPVVTNNGHCGHINKYLSGMLVPLMVLPPAIGAITGFIFMIFRNKRRGIGYLAEETALNS